MLFLQQKGTLIFTDTQNMKILKMDSNYHVKEIIKNIHISSSKGKVLKVSQSETSLLISTNLSKGILIIPDFQNRPEDSVKINLEKDEKFQDFGFLGDEYVLVGAMDGSIKVYSIRGVYLQTVKIQSDEDEEISCIDQVPESGEILVSISKNLKASKLVTLKAMDSAAPANLEVVSIHRFGEAQSSGRILKFGFSENTKNHFYFIETTGRSLYRGEIAETGEVQVSEVKVSNGLEGNYFLENGVLGAYTAGNTVWGIDFKKNLARLTIS